MRTLLIAVLILVGLVLLYASLIAAVMLAALGAGWAASYGWDHAKRPPPDDGGQL